MIYHLSLHTIGMIAGAFLTLVGLIGLGKPDFAHVVRRFPRSRIAGIVLLTICLAWTFWLLATIQMGEFSSFRRPLLIALPIGYVLVLRFVDEFLAVRALGILCLLAAEPLLGAACPRSRRCVTPDRARTSRYSATRILRCLPRTGFTRRQCARSNTARFPDFLRPARNCR